MRREREERAGQERRDDFAKGNLPLWKSNGSSQRVKKRERLIEKERQIDTQTAKGKRDEAADQSYYKNPQNNRRGSH